MSTPTKEIKTTTEKLASVIRIVTVPPVMVIALLLILYFYLPQPFGTLPELLTAIALLGLVPLLAYPLQPVFPHYRQRGREGRRELAFVLTGVGYTIAFLWALPAGTSPAVRTVCAGYCFSALLLTLCNKVLHRRASGHACSAVGPLLFLIYYFGWWLLLPSVVIAALIAWASVTLRRHTPIDLLWGTLCSMFGFAIAVLWF